MNFQIPVVDVTIDYPIDEVKTAISDIRNHVKPADGNGFFKGDVNETFGLFNFNIHYHSFASGLVAGKMQVTLNDVGEGKTKVNVSSAATTQGVLDNSKVQEVQTKFLNLLHSRLSNPETFNNSVSNTANNSGCLSFVILIIVTGLSIYLFACKG